MKKFPVDYIAIALLVFLSLGKITDWLMPKEGLTSEDIDRIVNVRESENREKELEIKFNEIVKRDEIIEKSINVDSIILWDSDRKYRDSIRAAINPS